MKARLALALLLGLAAALAGGPALADAPSTGCAADDAPGGCGLDCSLCLCCSPPPRTTAAPAPRAPAAGPSGDVGPEAAATPCGPLPRDILHVPKRVRLR
jgi:hypothetical protein